VGYVLEVASAERLGIDADLAAGVCDMEIGFTLASV
jgi:hypothetical protein